MHHRLLHLNKISREDTTLKAVQKFRKMPSKRGLLVLLFWLQSSFAQSSFFGPAADHLPFFSKTFPASPLVHFSHHSAGEGQRKYQTVDIVRFPILHNSTYLIYVTSTTSGELCVICEYFFYFYKKQVFFSLLLSQINLDFVAKSVCRNLRVFQCKS